MIDTWLIDPFVEFGFMRRALVGCLALSVGATPVGVFLMLRRMSLAGDPSPMPSCPALPSATSQRGFPCPP